MLPAMDLYKAEAVLPSLENHHSKFRKSPIDYYCITKVLVSWGTLIIGISYNKLVSNMAK